MERITDKMLAITYECRSDLKELEQRIQSYQENKALTAEEYDNYKNLMKECHESIRKKIYLLVTMLETESTEILDIVESRKTG
jgi:hypothetical protein